MKKMQLHWQKGLSIALAAVFAAASVPTSALVVNAEVKTAPLTPKYEMKLDGDISVAGSDGIKASLVTTRSLEPYAGTPVYTDAMDAVRGSAIDLTDDYGILMDDVAVDDTYTISFYAKMKENGELGWPWPICAVGAKQNRDDWVALAGESASQYQLWTSFNGNHIIGNAFDVPQGWAHYAISSDGTQVSLYENGVLKRKEENVKVDTTNGLRVMFGVNYWDNTPDCCIDEVKIYDETLTSAQVKALYTGFAITPDTAQVRAGRTITLDTLVTDAVEGNTISWISSDDSIASVADGVVTGITKGTAEVTAILTNGETEIARDTVSVSVLQESGQLIADFSFDDEENGFAGAGAIAARANDKETLSIVTDPDRGNVLQFSGIGGGDCNWLNVTKEDGSSLLAGLTEFTVSYDSKSAGAFMNCWTFFVDQPGIAPSARHYIALADYPRDLTVERYGESLSSGPAFSEWKHVDVVFNEYETSIYIDKKLCATQRNSHSVADSLGADNHTMIGKATWGNEYWAGMLDNYKIYDYALTEQEITSIPVTGIEITNAAEVTAGDVLPLTAAVTPADATNQNVLWSIECEDGVATLEGNTLYTTNPGTVTVTATAQDGFGAAASMDITVKAAPVPLEHHDAVAATCTTEGNIEYWSDPATGKLYKDAEGTIEVTDVTIPVIAHSYAQVWNWTKAGNGYTAKALFTCAVCQDSQEAEATVTSSDTGDTVTYTATVEFNGETYTASKEIALNFMLTVNGGTITGNAKESYAYGDRVTVTADSSRDGKYFSGWYVNDILVSQQQNYTFFMLSDLEVTAKYEGAGALTVQPTVFMSMSDRQTVAGTPYEKVSMTVQWSVPSGCTFVGAGIIRSYNESANLTLGNVDGSNIRQNGSTLTTADGTCVVNLTMSATTKLNPLKAVGYLTYLDSDGAEQTIYTAASVSNPTTASN